MHLEFNSKLNGFFNLTDFSCTDINKEVNQRSDFKIIWVKNAEMEFVIDGLPRRIPKQHLVFLTPHHQVYFDFVSEEVSSLSFNREFYCIKDHDHEVSCHGLLFYGSPEVKIIAMNEKEQKSFGLLFDVLIEEFQQNDQIQGRNASDSAQAIDHQRNSIGTGSFK